MLEVEDNPVNWCFHAAQPVEGMYFILFEEVQLYTCMYYKSASKILIVETSRNLSGRFH